MNKPGTVSKKLLLTSAVAGMTFTAPLAAHAYLNEKNVSESAMNTSQSLRFGERGTDVHTLQFTLKLKDYYHDKVDGIYGPLTQDAVRSYQATHGLYIDGIAGPQTLATLFSSNNSAMNPVPLNRLLEIGDYGHSVTSVQDKLQSLDYYSGAKDGIFGKVTERAVIKFQRVNELAVDGIVGPNTRSHLFSNGAEANRHTKTGRPRKLKENDRVKSSVNHSSLISNARALIGVNYVWGGKSPDGFDCSGYLNYVFEKIGINLPRTVSQIWNYGIHVNQPSVGDLVFFETYKPGPSHAGIYLGNQKFVHVSSSQGVTVTNMNMDYWRSRYIGAKRIVQHN